MKPRLAFSSLFLALTSFLPAQELLDMDDDAADGSAVPGSAPTAWVANRPAAELEKMVASIALYPDPLIALMLPAAAAPSDIVLASRFLAANPSVKEFEGQSWDDAVKGLAHYPEVLKWMDQNLEWTKQLGEAFERQPADLMAAIQRMRAQARVAGSLMDTPQQTVVVEESQIAIVPASTEVIYVPIYDPAVVYLAQPYPYYYSRPLITFSVGYRLGSWMAYDCDWRRRSVWCVRPEHRVAYWNDCRTRGYAYFARQPVRHDDRATWRAWRPAVNVRVSGASSHGGGVGRLAYAQGNNGRGDAASFEHRTVSREASGNRASSAPRSTVASGVATDANDGSRNRDSNHGLRRPVNEGRVNEMTSSERPRTRSSQPAAANPSVPTTSTPPPVVTNDTVNRSRNGSDRFQSGRSEVTGNSSVSRTGRGYGTDSPNSLRGTSSPSEVRSNGFTPSANRPNSGGSSASGVSAPPMQRSGTSSASSASSQSANWGAKLREAQASRERAVSNPPSSASASTSNSSAAVSNETRGRSGGGDRGGNRSDRGSRSDRD